jgi:hypothetical protein
MAEATGRRRGRLLVFVHVPKTAGTTLRTVLNMAQPGARSRALGNVFKGGGGIDKGMMARFAKRDGVDLSGVELVRGHVPLGIREYLPRHLPKQRDLQCFTFLREPAERTLSHYFQVREKHEGSGGPKRLSLSRLPADPTLDDLLDQGYIHDNLHTRMLSGDPEPFGEVTDEMLDRAKQNLRTELVFFGLTERFDESLVLAKRRLGLGSLLYRSDDRVNPTRPRGDAIRRDLLEAAQRCNRYDIELYRYATELFDGTPELEELEFQVDVAALTAARADGEIDLDVPAPAGFGGDEEAWRMLLQARAISQRLERELAGYRIRAEGERARTRELRQRIERLETDPALVEKLEREIEAFRSDSSRTEELEREIERLRTAAESTPTREVRRGTPRRGRPRKRASAASARSDTRHNGKRSGSRQARDGRKPRNAKRGGSTRKPRASRRSANTEGTGADG